MSAALVAVALALMVWPAAHSVRRLPVIAQKTGRGLSATARRRLAIPIIAVAATATAVWAAPTTTVIVVVVAAIAAQRMRRCERRRREQRRAASVIAALDTVTAEVRAGAPPAVACAAVIPAGSADAGSDPIADAFGRAAAQAVLGGTVAEALTAAAREHRELAAPAAAWELVEHHGLPVADLLGAARADLAAHRDHHDRVEAGLAGARATAAVLAGLPLLGLLLGQLMGADPIAVLLGGGLGGTAGVIGTVLIGAGLAWTDRITDRSAR